MYSDTDIQKLKQSNVSEDTEKTKVRVSTLWKGAPSDSRETILKLAGVTRPSVERVYRTGAISAKLVIPFAQTLQVNPFYLTGESESMDFDEQDLGRFLSKRGYSDQIEERKTSKATRKKVRQEQETVPTVKNTPADASFFDSLTEDEMVLLLRATILRAKAGGKDAETLSAIKGLLFS